MVSISYSALVFSGTCPHCDSPLCKLSDMWGSFYACEDCGYEFDPRDLEPKDLQLPGQPASAASSWLDRRNGSDGTRVVSLAASEVGALPVS